MSNTTHVTVSALLCVLIEAHQREVKSNLIKDVHSVSDSNLDCEKVCVNYINGDTIEFIVDDEDASVCAILTLKQRETNPDKLINGKLVYRIPKWTTEFKAYQISAYFARLMYIIKDVQAMYETGKFTALCTNSKSAIRHSLLHYVKEFIWSIKLILSNLPKTIANLVVNHFVSILRSLYGKHL